MKQTAIKISMISNIDNVVNDNTNNGEQLMTSLEVAQLTGKKHKDVLKAIRNMEPGWIHIAGRNFALGSYEDANKQLRPCYMLSKTETLFIATKFNDEARARLVLRWEDLEREKLKVKREEFAARERPKEIRLLACDEEVLNEADDILGDELAKLNRYSHCCYTPTEIGKPFGLDGRDLNSFLADKKIIRWAQGQWRLTEKYQNQDLTEDRYRYVHGYDGRRKLVSSLVWTEKGRQFVLDMLN